MKINPKKVLRKVFGAMPPGLRDKLIRSFVTLPNTQIPQLRVKIAHRKLELEQAFTLLHEAYVHAGFMEPNEAKLRVTKYHALPSTTTIVAMEGDEVVGTVSVVRDGLLGFPSDALVDKTKLRGTGSRIAEVSSLAICSRYRSQSHGRILWPLIAHLVRYSRDYFGTDYFVIAVHPTHFSFYESVLFFERLTAKPIEEYGFVNNNPAMCGLLNLRKFYQQMHSEYGHKPEAKNLFEYVFAREHDFLRFPRRDNFKISDPFLTPELLSYFFKERTSVFEGMTEQEIAILHHLYMKPEYRAILPNCNKAISEQLLENRTVRFDVACKGQITIKGDREIRLRVQNVSREGFYAILSENIRFGEELDIKIAVAEFMVSSLVCIPVWQHEGNHYGFRILHSDESWHEFINSLTRDLEQEHSQVPFSILPHAL